MSKSSMMSLFRVTAAGCLLLNATTSWAAEAQPPQPLPEPLTLEYALSLASDASHPEQQIFEADIRAAQADKLTAESGLGLNTWVEARLRFYQPPVNLFPDESRDDHRLGIFVDKTLYDFGRTRALVSAADKQIESSRILYQNSLRNRRIQIMQHYFDVLLADMNFYRYNEEMAVVYVALDKLRDKYEMGQVSDLQVLEKESEYQKVRKLRARSQNLQRVTRARLAYVLGHPGDLPGTVAKPESLPQLERKLAEVEILQQQALRESPRIRSLRAEITAARSLVDAANADGKPRLIGSAEASAYSKVRARNDTWRVNVILTVPLTTGGKVDAATSRERAEVYRLKAELSDLEEQIRQEVLELWLEIEGLYLQRDEMQTRTDYREIYLDRSRALYELEVNTDLGDAMVRVTETEREKLATDYAIVLAWEKMDLLTGNHGAEMKQSQEAK